MGDFNDCDHSLLSCTLLWCILLFNLTQFVILVNLSILNLALAGVKRLNHRVLVIYANGCSLVTFKYGYFIQIKDSCMLLKGNGVLEK